MFNRCLTTAVLLTAVIFGTFNASGAITVSSSGQSPLKNPGVLTLGTLAIEARVDFGITATSTTNAKLTYAWDWGDGTPLGSGAQPNHTYIVAGNYTVTVTVTEAGNPTPAVFTVAASITDAIKSLFLQTNENWAKANSDTILETGIIHIPNIPLAGQLVNVDTGGVQLNFVLDNKGTATLTTNINVDTTSSGAISIPGSSKASMKMFLKKRPATVAFVDTKFYLKYLGNVQTAFAFPALITNRNANRDNVRITCKITINAPGVIPILFQTGVNQVFTSKKGINGRTR